MKKRTISLGTAFVCFIAIGVGLFLLISDLFCQDIVLPDDAQVYFDKGSSEVKAEYIPVLKELTQIIKYEDLEVFFEASVDSVRWIKYQQQYEIAEDSVEGYLILSQNEKVYRVQEEHDVLNAALLVSRAYAVARVMNIPLDMSKVIIVPAQNERYVRVFASEKLNGIEALSDALLTEIESAQRADDALSRQIKFNRGMIGNLWRYLSKQKKYGHSVALAYEYVLIGTETEFSAPVLKYTSSQGFFGIEGHIGGMIADEINDEGTYDSVWGGLFFVRPYKHFKIGLGYKGISRFFESDLTWYNRHDCFWVNSEIELPLPGEFNLNLSFGGIKAYKWGSVTSLSISYDW